MSFVSGETRRGTMIFHDFRGGPLAPCDFLSLSAACCQSMSELKRSEPLTQGFIWVALVIVHRF